jgi:hypothetical protein
MKQSQWFWTLTVFVLGRGLISCSKVVGVRQAATSEVTPDAINIRTFDQMNETMAALTGLSVSAVATQYNKSTGTGIRNDLPSSNSLKQFNGAQQGAIVRLASYYCDAFKSKMNQPANSAAFSAFFQGLASYPTNVSQLTPDAINAMVAGFYNNFWGGCTNRPDLVSTQAEIQSMMSDLRTGTAASMAGGSSDTVDNYVSIICTTMLSASCVSMY